MLLLLIVLFLTAITAANQCRSCWRTAEERVIVLLLMFSFNYLVFKQRATIHVEESLTVCYVVDFLGPQLCSCVGYIGVVSKTKNDF